MINDEKILKRAKEIFDAQEISVEESVRLAVDEITNEEDFPIKFSNFEFSKDTFTKALIIQFVCEKSTNPCLKAEA